jgi:hypothetical protein
MAIKNLIILLAFYPSFSLLGPVLLWPPDFKECFELTRPELCLPFLPTSFGKGMAILPSWVYLPGSSVCQTKKSGLTRDRSSQGDFE